jgi:hypothetical protein
MQITKLNFRNCRSIEFGDTTVLIGQNNAGKKRTIAISYGNGADLSLMRRVSTMCSAEHAFLKNLKTHADQTCAFLSNAMKPERERSVCRAFLRALGVSFADSELIAPTIEPADVSFRQLRFQGRELLRGRKRGGAAMIGEVSKSNTPRLIPSPIFCSRILHRLPSVTNLSCPKQPQRSPTRQ